VKIHLHPNVSDVNALHFEVTESQTYFKLQDTNQTIYARGYLWIETDETSQAPKSVEGEIYYGLYERATFQGTLVSLEPSGNPPPGEPIPPAEPPPDAPPFSKFHREGVSQVIMRNREFDVFKFTNYRLAGFRPFGDENARLPFISFPGFGDLFPQLQDMIRENKSFKEIADLSKIFLEKNEALIKKTTSENVSFYQALNKDPSQYNLDTLCTYFLKQLELPPNECFHLKDYFLLMVSQRTCLWNGLIVLNILKDENQRELKEEIIQAIQIFQLIKRVGNKDLALDEPQGVFYALRAIILLPDELFMVDSLASDDEPPSENEKALDTAEEELPPPNERTNPEEEASVAATTSPSSDKAKDIYPPEGQGVPKQIEDALKKEPSKLMPISQYTPSFRTKVEDTYVRILGFGDLYVVRNELRRYELGEIARVENAMMGQYLDYSNKKLIRKEESKAKEEEIWETEENELSNLQHEITLVAQADKKKFAIDPDDKMTRDYKGTNETVSGGWTVTIEPNNAQEYALQILDKALQALQRKKKYVSRQVIFTETTDSQINILDNKSGSQNISGIFRRINKVFDAQLFYLGYRLLLECLVPVPAKEYLKRDRELFSPSPPPLLPPNFDYSQIDRSKKE
ncbi:MAG: hypothetical protein AAFU64_08500, partial [Bacteroidota bacterium]